MLPWPYTGLLLFVCTHNFNKTLCLNETKQKHMMRFLPSHLEQEHFTKMNRSGAKTCLTNAISWPICMYFTRWLIRTNSYNLTRTILYDLSKHKWRVLSLSFLNCFILFLFVCPAAHPSPPFAGDRRRHPRLPQASQSPWGKPNHCPRFTQVCLISSGLLVTPRCSCGSALPCLDLPCLESLKTVICSLRVPRSSLVCAPWHG